MILLTRPLEDSKKLANKLNEKGAEVIIEPMIEIEKLNPQIPDADYYITTSRHARSYVPKGKEQISIPEHGKNAEEILAYCSHKNGRFCYLSADEVTLDIAARLPNSKRVVVYNSIPATTLKTDLSTIDVAVFYSRKTLRNFLQLAQGKDLKYITFVCYSPEIAWLAEGRKAIYPENQTLDEMVDLIIKAV